MVSFNEKHIDLGEVIQSEQFIEFQVVVTNNSPYILRPNIQVSCGCTLPTLEPRTLKPREEGLMTIRLNTLGEKEGSFQKNVKLESYPNGEKFISKLTFSGNVKKK